MERGQKLEIGNMTVTVTEHYVAHNGRRDRRLPIALPTVSALHCPPHPGWRPCFPIEPKCYLISRPFPGCHFQSLEYGTRASHCPPRHARYHATPSLKKRPRSFGEQSCRRCEVHGGKQWHFPSAPRLQDISGPQPDSGQPVPHALASPLITSKLRGLGRSAAAQQRSKALIPRGPRDFES